MNHKIKTQVVAGIYFELLTLLWNYVNILYNYRTKCDLKCKSQTIKKVKLRLEALN